MRLLILFLSLFCINVFAESTYEETKRESTRAFNEYKQQAEEGDALGQLCLSNAYNNGVGCYKNEALALSWLRKSAEQGLPEAQRLLGYCYEVGDRGLMTDYVEAYAYFNLAATTLKYVREERNDLEKKMTPSQIEAGQKRSKELQKEIEAKISDKTKPWWKISK